MPAMIAMIALLVIRFLQYNSFRSLKIMIITMSLRKLLVTKAKKLNSNLLYHLSLVLSSAFVLDLQVLLREN